MFFVIQSLFPSGSSVSSSDHSDDSTTTNVNEVRQRSSSGVSNEELLSNIQDDCSKVSINKNRRGRTSIVNKLLRTNGNHNSNGLIILNSLAIVLVSCLLLSLIANNSADDIDNVTDVSIAAKGGLSSIFPSSGLKLQFQLKQSSTPCCCCCGEDAAAGEAAAQEELKKSDMGAGEDPSAIDKSQNAPASSVTASGRKTSTQIEKEKREKVEREAKAERERVAREKARQDAESSSSSQVHTQQQTHASLDSSLNASSLDSSHDSALVSQQSGHHGDGTTLHSTESSAQITPGSSSHSHSSPASTIHGSSHQSTHSPHPSPSSSVTNGGGSSIGTGHGSTGGLTGLDFNQAGTEAEKRHGEAEKVTNHLFNKMN